MAILGILVASATNPYLLASFGMLCVAIGLSLVARAQPAYPDSLREAAPAPGAGGRVGFRSSARRRRADPTERRSAGSGRLVREVRLPVWSENQRNLEWPERTCTSVWPVPVRFPLVTSTRLGFGGRLTPTFSHQSRRESCLEIDSYRGFEDELLEPRLARVDPDRPEMGTCVAAPVDVAVDHEEVGARTGPASDEKSLRSLLWGGTGTLDSSSCRPVRSERTRSKGKRRGEERAKSAGPAPGQTSTSNGVPSTAPSVVRRRGERTLLLTPGRLCGGGSCTPTIRVASSWRLRIQRFAGLLGSVLVTTATLAPPSPRPALAAAVPGIGKTPSAAASSRTAPAPRRSTRPPARRPCARGTRPDAAHVTPACSGQRHRHEAEVPVLVPHQVDGATAPFGLR